MNDLPLSVPCHDRRTGDSVQSKVCTDCGRLEPLSRFRADSSYRKGYGSLCHTCTYAKYGRPYYQRNRERINQQQVRRYREWRESNPGHASAKNRRFRLQRAYGLSEGEYLLLLDRQGGVCATCRRPETARDHGRVRPLSVDHDHETGMVRGLLCSKCNSAIGYADDEPERLLELAIYLERSRTGDRSRIEREQQPRVVSGKKKGRQR